MINRRLYLASPTEIQRLLIVPYKLGTISCQDNRDNSLRFQRAQDNNGITVRSRRTIAARKTIEKIMDTNNNCCLTIGWVRSEAIRLNQQMAEHDNMA